MWFDLWQSHSNPVHLSPQWKVFKNDFWLSKMRGWKLIDFNSPSVLAMFICIYSDFFISQNWDSFCHLKRGRLRKSTSAWKRFLHFQINLNVLLKNNFKSWVGNELKLNNIFLSRWYFSSPVWCEERSVKITSLSAQ